MPQFDVVSLNVENRCRRNVLVVNCAILEGARESAYLRQVIFIFTFFIIVI